MEVVREKENESEEAGGRRQDKDYLNVGRGDRHREGHAHCGLTESLQLLPAMQQPKSQCPSPKTVS